MGEPILGDRKQFPLLILHGFLGSSSNWVTTGKELANFFDVYALDLRNHGKSPHAEPMNYEAMAEDVFHWLDTRDLGKVVLLGHSLGGKLAMKLACRYPELVRGLIIEDIAPKPYIPSFDGALAALLEVDLKSMTSRKQIDDFLINRLNDSKLCHFLMTNLSRDEQGFFYWQANFSILKNSQGELVKNPLAESDVYKGPCLVLKGEKSRFLRTTDRDLFHKHFSNCVIQEIAGAGHNIHSDNRRSFVDTVRGFNVE
ncbi:MAG: hypothetical protein A2007_02460 [Verrucomicrobia bacterium GWC2_42_7]|nr:MAG: hypothetical protein A2007_02460 [Verrucomicrobia bacterium GWC2_42_7]